MLLDLSDRVLERLAPDQPAATAVQADALATIWLRAIYGVADPDHPRPARRARGRRGPAAP
jgi:hypothetical protein